MTYPINQPLTYTAVASTQGMPSNTFTYSWQFDDSTTATGNTLSKAWTTQGIHGATVTATDNVTGAKATATKFVDISPSGVVYTITTIAGLYGTDGRVDATGSSARFSELYGITVDPATGDLYTGSTDLGSAPYDGHCIRKITQAGVVTTLMVGQGSPTLSTGTPVDGPIGTATSGWPFCVAWHPSGDLYIVDGNTDSRAIRVVHNNVASLFAGSYTVSGYTDATGTSATFTGLRNICFSSDGTIGYVLQATGCSIRKFTIPGAVVTTLAGSNGNSGSADGTGTSARFNLPRGMCIGTDGNLYVADTGNHTIRQVTPAGVVTTVAGLAGNAGSADGVGSSARFNLPYAITESGPGVFYIWGDGSLKLRRMIYSGGVYTVDTVMGSGVRGGADGSGTSPTIDGVGITSWNNTLYVTNTTTVRKITWA